MNYLKGNSLEDEGSAIEGKCAMECNSSGNLVCIKCTLTFLMIIAMTGALEVPYLANTSKIFLNSVLKEGKNLKLYFLYNQNFEFLQVLLYILDSMQCFQL